MMLVVTIARGGNLSIYIDIRPFLSLHRLVNMHCFDWRFGVSVSMLIYWIYCHPPQVRSSPRRIHVQSSQIFSLKLHNILVVGGTAFTPLSLYRWVYMNLLDLLFCFASLSKGGEEFSAAFCAFLYAHPFGRFRWHACGHSNGGETIPKKKVKRDNGMVWERYEWWRYKYVCIYIIWLSVARPRNMYIYYIIFQSYVYST